MKPLLKERALQSDHLIWNCVKFQMGKQIVWRHWGKVSQKPHASMVNTNRRSIKEKLKLRFLWYIETQSISHKALCTPFNVCNFVCFVGWYGQAGNRNCTQCTITLSWKFYNKRKRMQEIAIRPYKSLLSVKCIHFSNTINSLSHWEAQELHAHTHNRCILIRK